jgi:aspartate/methionine/tyrosine aminotransferase
LSQFSITSLPPFSQIAAQTALTDSGVNAYSEEMRAMYHYRLKHIIARVRNTWLEEAMVIPDGAFYVLINVSRFGVGSLELAKRIVDFGSVSLTPGIAFGNGMDGYLRMCFAASIDAINSAIDVLIQFEKNDH